MNTKEYLIKRISEIKDRNVEIEELQNLIIELEKLIKEYENCNCDQVPMEECKEHGISAQLNRSQME